MMLNMVLALLAGLGLAAMVVLGLEQIDEGIRNPDDVRNFLKVPLLGNVPLASGTPLEDIIDPKSHFSEAYFSIHSTLAFATNHGLPKAFAITSAQPGEGKSTTAFALAEIIGRTGKRVVRQQSIGACQPARGRSHLSRHRARQRPPRLVGDYNRSPPPKSRRTTQWQPAHGGHHRAL